MNNVKSIDGATPPIIKDFSHKMNYNLYTKDATGQDAIHKIKKFHNPLDPRYIH